MSTHDDSLQKALEENAKLRSEREETLREASSAEFMGHARFAERLYWIYAIILVAIGVPAINFFVGSYDTKALIGCAVIILVVYETTVLMKLWFAIVKMRMGVLKDVKLLRFEVAQIAAAVGVERPAEPSVKYEPVRGASPWERKLWIVACVVVAMTISSWVSYKFELGSDGGQVEDDTMITLAGDGSATIATDIVKPCSSFYRSKEYPFLAPKDWKVRFVDPQGHEMPVEVTPEGTHNRHQVTLTEAVFSDGQMRHTRISKCPNAATQKDGVWNYTSDIVYSGRENRFRITVSLPAGAKVLSTDPAPILELDQDGQTVLRFQATRAKNEKFVYSVYYALPTALGAK